MSPSPSPFEQHAPLFSASSLHGKRDDVRGAPLVRSHAQNAGVLAELFGRAFFVRKLPLLPTDALSARRRSLDDARSMRACVSSSLLTALVDAVLVAGDLPELGSDLVAALAGLEGHDLAHGGEEEKEEEEVESAEKGGGKE